MKNWWNHLKKIGLISEKKLYRLTRSTYSDEAIEGFINRQLVETRQITKHVANIINNLYKNTKVVYLKASLTHNYREKYELFKFREINDYHHAHDAFLAAVLGEYKEKYMKKNINFEIIKEINSKLKELGNYNQLKYGFIINSLDENVNDVVLKLSENLINKETGEILFDAKEFNKKLEDTLYRNDILISKKTEIRSGKLYDETKQKKGNKGVPLKSNMPKELYGSYTSIKPAYATMVKYTKNKKENCRMMGLPIYLNGRSLAEKETYYKNILNLKESDTIEISKRKIPFYSYLNWNNQICYLVGASDKVEIVNALQFHYKKGFYKSHKASLNKLFNGKDKEKDTAKYNNDLTNIIKYILNTIENDYELFKKLIKDLKLIVKYNNNVNLTIEEKEKVIIQLTLLLNCKSDNANFKFLNRTFSSAFGKKNDRIIEKCNITNYSVTGIKKRKYYIGAEKNEF